MNLLSSKVHGILDYVASMLFIASPWLFNFAKGGAETWIPVVIGAGSVIMSVITDYELGATRTMPLSTHLTIDVVAGIFLSLSPWLFGFAGYVFLPHLMMGLFELGTSLLTERSTGYRATVTR